MNKAKGFSYSEIISVLAIVSLLASAGAGTFVNCITAAQYDKCQLSTLALTRAERYFFLSNSYHTTTFQNLHQVGVDQLVATGFLTFDYTDTHSEHYFWVIDPKGNYHAHCAKCETNMLEWGAEIALKQLIEFYNTESSYTIEDLSLELGYIEDFCQQYKLGIINIDSLTLPYDELKYQEINKQLEKLTITTP